MRKYFKKWKNIGMGKRLVLVFCSYQRNVTVIQFKYVHIFIENTIKLLNEVY